MRIEAIGEFLEIVNCGSLSSTARNLHISTSSLSRHIQLLEQELGFPLFEYSGTDFQSAIYALTPQGELFLNEGSKAFSQYNEMVEECRRLDKQKLETVIFQEYSVSDDSSKIRFGILNDIKAANSNIKIEMLFLSKESPVDAIKNGKLDIGQTNNTKHPESFCKRCAADHISAIPVFKEHLYVWYNPNSSVLQIDGSEIISIGTLTGVPVKVPFGQYYSPLRSYIDHTFKSNNLMPLFHFFHQTGEASSDFYLDALKTPDCIYILPESMLSNVWVESINDKMASLKLVGKNTDLYTYMLVKETTKNEGARFVKDIIEKYRIQEIPKVGDLQ